MQNFFYLYNFVDIFFSLSCKKDMGIRMKMYNRSSVENVFVKCFHHFGPEKGNLCLGENVKL